MKRYTVYQAPERGDFRCAGLTEDPVGPLMLYDDLPEVIRKARLEGASAFCEAVNEEAKAGRSGIGISVDAIVSKLEGR